MIRIVQIPTLPKKTQKGSRSAGGVIDEAATTEEALATLQAGVSLSGSQYAPLTSMPDTSMMIGSVPYSLEYDPATGFSYVPSGSELGEVFTAAGTSDGVGANGSSFPFDITDPAAVSQALTTFASMEPSNPNYQSYLDAFSAASSMNTLPAGDLAAMNATLAESLINIDGNWLQPVFDVTNPAAALTAAQSLATSRGDAAAYAALTASLGLALSTLPPESVAEINTAAVNEMLTVTDQWSGDRTAALAGNWAGLDLTGVSLNYKVLADTQITGEQLNSVASLYRTNLSGTNLEGFTNPSALSLSRVDLSNTSGLTWDTLLTSTNWIPWLNADNGLKEVNLAGAVVSGTPNLTARNLEYCNFAGMQGLTGADLNNTYSLYGANLSGIDLREFDAAAKTLSWADLSGTNISGAELNTAEELQGTKFSGLDLTGFSPAMALRDAVFSGSNVTVEMLANVPKDRGLWDADFRNTGVTKAALLAAGWTEDGLVGAKFD